MPKEWAPHWAAAARSARKSRCFEPGRHLRPSRDSRTKSNRSCKTISSHQTPFGSQKSIAVPGAKRAAWQLPAGSFEKPDGSRRVEIPSTTKLLRSLHYTHRLAAGGIIGRLPERGSFFSQQRRAVRSDQRDPNITRTVATARHGKSVMIGGAIGIDGRAVARAQRGASKGARIYATLGALANRGGRDCDLPRRDCGWVCADLPSQATARSLRQARPLRAAPTDCAALQSSAGRRARAVRGALEAELA